MATSTTTFTAPALHSTRESVDGYAYKLIDSAELQLAIADQADVLSSGVVQFMADLAGSGSDTSKQVGYGGLGFSTRFAEMGTESEAISASSFTALAEDVTVAPFGLSHAQTWVDGILGRVVGGVADIDTIKALIPKSYAATIRFLAVTAGAGQATDIGASTTKLSVDDMLDLIVAREGASAVDAGPLTAVLHSVQLSHLRESARSDPAFQFPEAFAQTQGDRSGSMVIPNLLALNIKALITNDVTTAASALQGWAQSAPLFGAVAKPGVFASRLVAAGHSVVMEIPEYGILVTESWVNGVRSYEARCLVGVAIRHTSLAFQRGLLSQTTA